MSVAGLAGDLGTFFEFQQSLRCGMQPKWIYNVCKRCHSGSGHSPSAIAAAIRNQASRLR
jgi:hypothetical protein